MLTQLLRFFNVMLFSTKNAPNGEAEVADVAALPIHVTTKEVQDVGVLNTTTEDGT